MAELLGVAEVVVIHGYCIGEATGRALRIPDTDPDAEPGDTIVGPVVSEPVALAEQAPLPMLRALAAHAHIQAQPVRTTPDDATGYYALGSLSTNDPDVEPYAGRRVTLPDGTAKVIQLAYNAVATTVDAAMAAQVNAGRPAPLVTVGQTVRAVWLPDAAEYVAPEPAGPAYYTAEQVDSLLEGLLANAVTEDDLDARIAVLIGTAGAPFDTLGELATGVQANASAVAARLVAAQNLADLPDKAASRNNLGLKPLATLDTSGTADATTVLYGDGVYRTPTGGGGGGNPDVPENLAGTQAAAASASSLLSVLTRYNTTAGAINQTLPAAIAGRYLGIGWETGNPALTLIGASRTDTATVTSGQASVQDAAIGANDYGRLVTGTGIPAGTYVGTVTAGTSFLLSSSPTTQVNVSATAAGTSVTLTDVIGSSTATYRMLEAPETVLLHATTTGRWRIWAGHRPFLPPPTPALDRVQAALATAVTSPVRVVFAGSSTTFGTGASTAAASYVNKTAAAVQAAYPAPTGAEAAVSTSLSGTLSTTPGVQPYNVGVGGTTSADYISTTLQSQIIAAAPAVVIHMIGSNDFYFGTDPATYKSNVAAKLSAIRSGSPNTVHVLVQSYQRLDVGSPVYPWAAYASALRELAGASPADTAFIDVSGPFAAAGVPGSDPIDLIGTDNVHSTDRGHALLADAVRGKLRVVGPPKPAPTSPSLFQARATANQTLANANTVYPVALVTEDFDDTDAHSMSTNTGRFVAPRAGVYRASAAVLFNSGQSTASGTSRNMQLSRNGSKVPSSQVLGTYAGTFFTLTMSPILVALAAGDYLELQAFSGLAGTVLYGAASDGSVFTVELVR